jgi:hypothetical protein
MASTIRRLILENIQTTLEGISFLNKVALHEFSVIDLDTYPLPAAFIFPDSDDAIENEDRWAKWTLPVVIEVWGEDITIEDLIGEIYQAMMSDRTRGGYAEQTERLGGTDIVVIDPARSLGSFTMQFEIVYRHLPNNPYSQEQP